VARQAENIALITINRCQEHDKTKAGKQEKGNVMSTVFRVQKNANYTTMSNYHLKDRRLSYKAKGLLSVILSLPDEWDYSLKGLAYISDDGVDGVRGGIRELEKYGYISRGAQTRDKRGRMSANEYFVFENPEQNPYFDPEKESTSGNGSTKPKSAVLENPTRSKSDTSTALENPTRCNFDKSAALDFPITENPSTEKPITVNPTTGTYYNNKILNNQVLTDQSIHQSNSPPNKIISTDRIDGTDNSEKSNYSFSALKEKIPDRSEREEFLELIRRNIDYDYFPASEKTQVDEFVEIMLDEICGVKDTVRVNKAEMPREVVKARFLKLGCEHIEYVLDELRRCSPDMQNPRAYLITTLYNAPVTIDNRYSAMALHDIAAGKI